MSSASSSSGAAAAAAPPAAASPPAAAPASPPAAGAATAEGEHRLDVLLGQDLREHGRIEGLDLGAGRHDHLGDRLRGHFLLAVEQGQRGVRAEELVLLRAGQFGDSDLGHFDS